MTTVVNGATLCTTTPTIGSSISGSGVWSMANDTAGNIYFAQRSNGVVCKLTSDGNVVRVAGNGAGGAGIDNGPATSSPLGGPISIAVDANNNLYIAEYDSNYSIRKVNSSGTITTILNSAHTKSLGATGSAAVTTTSSGPLALAVSPSGEIYYSEYANQQVRKIDLNGNVQLVAGTGTAGTTGDGGLATAAPIASVSDIDFDSSGNIYLTSYSGFIRKIDTNGIITRFAGSYSTRSHTGDNGQALSATFQFLWQSQFDGEGNLFIPERGGSTIRKIDTSGTLTTIAGLDGTSGNANGQSLTNARFNSPFAIAIGGDNSLFISDYGNSIIRKIAGAASGQQIPISVNYNPMNTFRLSSTITAAGGTPGKITFYADGKRIAGCISKPYTSSYSCSWKPAKRGNINLLVKIVATDGSIQASELLRVSVKSRTGLR